MPIFNVDQQIHWIKKHDKGKLKTMALFDQYVDFVFLREKRLFSDKAKRKSSKTCNLITINYQRKILNRRKSMFSLKYCFLISSDVEYSTCAKDKNKIKR